jgi:hypothetical protein
VKRSVFDNLLRELLLSYCFVRSEVLSFIGIGYVDNKDMP